MSLALPCKLHALFDLLTLTPTLDQVEDLAAKLKEASEAIVKVTNDFGSVQTGKTF